MDSFANLPNLPYSTLLFSYGTNGSYSYIDKSDQPFPAIRFREDTPEIKVLREKEKGDWKNLTIEEKKTRKCPCKSTGCFAESLVFTKISLLIVLIALTVA